MKPSNNSLQWTSFSSQLPLSLVYLVKTEWLSVLTFKQFLSYRETFNTPTPVAYKTLLWDAMVWDATLFMRADQVEAAWRLLMPVLEVWKDNPAPDFPNYAAGSWGPESADVLIVRNGRSWFTPTAQTSGKKTGWGTPIGQCSVVFL